MTWLNFAYVNKEYFPIVFYEYFYLLLCGFGGCSMMVTILVIC